MTEDIYSRAPLRVQGGIPVFSEDDEYIKNYDKISGDHLESLKKDGTNPFMQEELWVELENSTVALIKKYSKPGDTILDVGVGLGRVLSHVPSLKRYGMDISMGYLEVSKAQGINVCKARVDDMPYREEMFDVVVCMDVLEHVFDLNLCVKKLLSVLKKTGTLIVRVPFLEDLSPYLWPSYPYKYAHLRNFDEDSLRLLFERIFDCRVIKMVKTGFLPYDNFLHRRKRDSYPRRVEKRLMWLYPRLRKYYKPGYDALMKMLHHPYEINVVVKKSGLAADCYPAFRIETSIEKSVMERQKVNGILVLYHHYFARNAPTIMEHVNAFEDHSRNKVWSINTEYGFLKTLNRYRFKAIVLHYSLFAPDNYRLDAKYLQYLEESAESYKVAFFQDEFHYCKSRFEFLNKFKVNCVYTCLEPRFFKDVYYKYTSVSKCVSYIPGHVSDDLIKASKRYAKPDEERRLDIGYRGRSLPYYLGRGAQEKSLIGIEFRRRADALGLNVDIEVEEQSRLYGDKWYRFLAESKGTIGVESGVSVYDTEDVVVPEYKKMIAENPGVSFEEVHEKILKPYEDNIYLRTISPRHFEAAAFRICQILFEGKYSGIMQPMVHYIPLKKDYSNIEEAVRLFKDPAVRRTITDNAWRDLIASCRYGYASFIGEFDNELEKEGLALGMDTDAAVKVTRAINRSLATRKALAFACKYSPLNLSLWDLTYPLRKPFLWPIKKLLKIQPDKPLIPKIYR